MNKQEKSTKFKNKQIMCEGEFNFLYQELIHFSRTLSLLNNVIENYNFWKIDDETCKLKEIKDKTEKFKNKDNKILDICLVIDIVELFQYKISSAIRRFIDLIIKEDKLKLENFEYKFWPLNEIRKEIEIISENNNYKINKKSINYKKLLQLKKTLEKEYLHFNQIDFTSKNINSKELNKNYNFLINEIINLKKYFYFFKKIDKKEIKFSFLSYEKIIFGDIYKNGYYHIISVNDEILKLN